MINVLEELAESVVTWSSTVWCGLRQLICWLRLQTVKLCLIRDGLSILINYLGI